ncbi:hypothetical protein AGMMS49928_07170 [Spirochaetia bacterium]|nr:hypothetical protein AGMMS49928_07170 [Spirochaetia bacterium]
MKRYRGLIFILMILIAGTAALYAQVQGDNDVVMPDPQFQDHGGVTPWFWIGAKAIFSGGYNFETGAGGFRDYGGSNNTYASFNFAFVDSRYGTPKFYEVPRNLDPDAWTGHFKFMNFTTRINSWSQNEDAVENNRPAWLAEITGKGFHVGFFTQAGTLLGSLDDITKTDTNNNPAASIVGGNKVLPIGDDDLGKSYYEIRNSKSLTKYSIGNNGALWYLGYEKPELFNAYLTILSEGNVNSNTTDTDKDGSPNNDGIAGVIDFNVSPFGSITDDEHKFTFDLSGNVITGFRWELPTKENLGFGLKAQPGIWLYDNFVLSPVIAFDGKLNTDNDFTWKIGGGLTFQFSGMRWVEDNWGELSQLGQNGRDYKYENSKILKYAYAQAYAAYSEDEDLDLVIKAEEPDGDAGFHEKLGAALEFRLYNLTKKITTNTRDWAAQARISYSFDVKSYEIIPSLRAYLDSDAVLKLRAGTEANIIPYTCFEIAYTSANLNKGVDGAWKPMSHYDSVFDAGRLELIVTLQSDNIKPRAPKRWAEWGYANSLTDM